MVREGEGTYVVLQCHKIYLGLSLSDITGDILTLLILFSISLIPVVSCFR